MCVKFSPENLNPDPYSSHSTSTYTWWGYLINGYLCTFNALMRIKHKINPNSLLYFNAMVIFSIMLGTENPTLLVIQILKIH